MKLRVICSVMTACSLLNCSAVAQKEATKPVLSVCEVLRKPSQFNGRLIRLKGTASTNFEYFGLSDGCGQIWIDFTDDAWVSPKPPFKTVRDKKFAEFDRMLRSGAKVSVTMLGRLDGVDEIKRWTVVRDRRKGKDGSESAVVGQRSTGFGHMGEYKARLVLKRVETVEDNAPAPPNH